jgi:hypothetical protein
LIKDNLAGRKLFGVLFVSKNIDSRQMILPALARN